MFGLPASRVLIASLIAGILGVGGILITPQKATDSASIMIESSSLNHSVGETFTVKITTEAIEPVNVFKGLFTFNPDLIEISAINYNVSFINLWAEEPWYSNGDGTLGFTGGTIRPGGFTGKETLITITFRAKSVGVAILAVKEIRILKHDGIGNEANVSEPIDSIFSITKETRPSDIIIKPDLVGPVLQVLPRDISTDLNQDGKQSIVDISIFMIHLTTQNLKSDFNQDGSVNLKDLSILNRK